MTDRLAAVRARIDGMRQLGSVVSAMRGIAAARAQTARSQLAAVDRYAATIVAAIARADVAATKAGRSDARPARPRSALVLFCAEEGFAGAYGDRMLALAASDAGASEIFLVGRRGAALASERGIAVAWSDAMPSQSAGIPRLADRIAHALFDRLATGAIDRIDAAHGRWEAGSGLEIERVRLLPLDGSASPPATGREVPLFNLPPEEVVRDLAGEYLHARLCRAALCAFAAENQARMEAMASARQQIDRQLADLRATERRVRQEEITAEVLELTAASLGS